MFHQIVSILAQLQAAKWDIIEIVEFLDIFVVAKQLSPHFGLFLFVWNRRNQYIRMNVCRRSLRNFSRLNLSRTATYRTAFANQSAAAIATTVTDSNNQGGAGKFKWLALSAAGIFAGVYDVLSVLRIFHKSGMRYGQFCNPSLSTCARIRWIEYDPKFSWRCLESNTCNRIIVWTTKALKSTAAREITILNIISPTESLFETLVV